MSESAADVEEVEDLMGADDAGVRLRPADGVAQGATLAVRAGNSLVRVAQSGLVRYYALLLMSGVTALALYFLIVAR